MSIVVNAMHRYPVKSMGGQSLTRTHLGEFGIPGDRCWTLQDAVRQDLKIGKRNPKLMGMSAHLLEEPNASNPSPPVEIKIDDATRARSDDPDIETKLSNALEQSARLWPLLPKDQLDHYRRKPNLAQEEATANADPAAIEQSLRDVFARTPEEPLPDLSIFPAELFEYESPPGTYFDAFPLLIVAQSSLAALALANAEAEFDVRRFRPNIVVDAAEELLTDQRYVENGWADRRARIGGALLQMHMPCPRCIMTTHGFDDLAKDPTIMRTLVRENAGNLGIYASVIQPGEVNVGDALEFED